MDRVFNKLLNNKYEDRIENALKIRGYATPEDLVNALKARYNTIYTGKYDLDVTFTLVLFKTYTVTFKDENGNVLSTQKVVAGDGAADPVYHGGDVLNVNYTTSDNYDKVMEDMTVTLYPIHELKVEYTPDADCLNDGVKRTYCTVSGCDYEVEESVPAHGHDYEAVVTAPTCTEDGYTTYTCTVCGDSYVDDIVAALGHEWSDWTVIVQPPDTECGVKITRCYSCGCEERANFDHDYEAVVTAPSCTEEGYTTYTCSRCGDSYVDDTVAALGHDYEAVVTAPTCTEEGYTTHTCSRCGDSYVDNTVAALGHDYVLTEKLDPTREEDGYEIHTCSRCGDTQKKVLPPIGNEPDAGDEGILVFVVLAFVAVAGIAIVSKAKMAR
jgi:transposase-like protein